MYKKVILIFAVIIVLLLQVPTNVSIAIEGGNTFDSATMIVSEQTTVSIKGGNTYFKFIPTVSGQYTITTISSNDSNGILYDSLKNELIEDDESGDGSNFSISWGLTANQTYYIEAFDWDLGGSESNEYTLSITGGGLQGINSAPAIAINNPTNNVTYGNGDIISIAGTTSDSDGDDVTVSAAIDGNTQSTTVSGGSGNWTLNWDIDILGISDGVYTGITFTVDDGNGGTNTANYTGNITVDLTAPTVSSVSVPINNSYITGENLDFTVNYDENVTVDTSGGTPFIPVTLNTGGTVNADYISGTGTQSLIFRYIVQSGNLDTDGVSVGTLVDLNGASIKDSVGNTANLTLNSIGSTTSVFVDGISPSVLLSDNDTDNLVKENDTVTITAKFNEVMANTPTISIANGGVTGVNMSDSGDGMTWTYDWIVPSGGAIATVTVTGNDSAGNTYTGSDNLTFTIVDSDGTVTVGSEVDESSTINIPTIADSMGEAIEIFDFTLTDSGTSDGQNLIVTAIDTHVSGTGVDKLTYILTNPSGGGDLSGDIIGSYSGGTVSFDLSSSNITIDDGTNETYVVKAYYNDNTGITDNTSITIGIDGDTDIVVNGSGTQMADIQSAIDNNGNANLSVNSTELSFGTQPAGSESGIVLTTQPVVRAIDSFGNLDEDFTEIVIISEGSAGNLSGDLDIIAINGIATFTDIIYTATADKESFKLTANDEDGTGSDLPTVDSNSIASEVIATKLIFTIEPSPIGIIKGQIHDFTTDPVVKAVDTNNIIDIDFAETVTISENGAGSSIFTNNSAVASNGVATFTGLTINHDVKEVFQLVANDEDGVDTNLTIATSIDISASDIQITISPDQAMTEDNLDLRSIDITLDGTTFVDNTLDKGNFTLNNGLSSISIESVSYTDTTHCTVNLAYDGTDFDSDISNLGITILGAELTSGSDVTSNNTLGITATNDVEGITITDDGNILEVEEDGEVITVQLTGGQFNSIIDENNWTVANLPTGVGKGTITRIDDTTIEIQLSGNTTIDYDTDITNVTVECTNAEYVDSTGDISLTSNAGITLIAKTTATVTTDGSITGLGAIKATISGEVTSDGNITVTERGIEYKKSTEADTAYTKVLTSAGGTGVYSVDITGLEPETNYDVRAYAINTEGTSYGNVVSFQTNAQSSNANLTGVIISNGSLNPVFDINITLYTATVSNSISNIKVTPTLQNDFASIKVNGQVVINNQQSQTISLSVGKNTINVEITAEDGVTKKTYVFEVTRNRAPYVPPQEEEEEEEIEIVEDDNEIEIIIDGKIESAATITTEEVEGNTVATVEISSDKVKIKLDNSQNQAKIIVPVNSEANTVIGKLNGQTIKDMENKEAILEIKTKEISYSIPASQINIDDVSKKIGENVELKDIDVSVKISEPKEDVVKIVEDTADKNKYNIVVKPVEFEISCKKNGKTVEVSKFNNYVERMVAIPDGIDPSKITTGIVLNADGTFSHVPTTVIEKDGKYYAIINSLTNSTYSVIWNQVEFKDVENHWSKEAVNDMGSRLVINGLGENIFEPDRDITRGEFITVLVKALGLMRVDTGENTFDDVYSDDWYYDAVSIAYDYELTSGYEDNTFRPNEDITREEAMAMIARAMVIANYDIDLTEDKINSTISQFDDNGEISNWAKQYVAACVKEELVVGYNNKLMVKNNITRAETAVIVRRMLKKAKLI